MPILPAQKTTAVVKDGELSSVLLFALDLKSSVRKTLVEKFVDASDLPNGLYTLETQWTLIKGFQWKLTKLI